MSDKVSCYFEKTFEIPATVRQKRVCVVDQYRDSHIQFPAFRAFPAFPAHFGA